LIHFYKRLHQIEGMAPEAGRMSGNLLIQDRPSMPSVPSHQPVPSLQPPTQITQEVRNRNLLNTMFKFKKDAPLRQFIHDITKVQKNYYSLAEILTILKDVISSEKMFDERNPSVIICSKPLEAALNQRALHVTEVRDLVINQLERLADQSLRDNLPSQRINSSQPRSQLARGGSRTPGRETVQYTWMDVGQSWIERFKVPPFQCSPLSAAHGAE
jgi:hypothetical protein